MTKLVPRIAAALTILAFAAPALPCGDMKQTSASAQPAPATTPKDAVAKKAGAADQKSQKADQKTASSGVKKTTATN